MGSEMCIRDSVGARRQRGHGLGSIFGSLFRNVLMPFLKRNAGALAGNVLKTGMQVMDGVVQGKSLQETAKRRIPDAIKKLHETSTGRSVPESRSANVFVVVSSKTYSTTEYGLYTRRFVRVRQV